MVSLIRIGEGQEEKEERKYLMFYSSISQNEIKDKHVNFTQQLVIMSLIFQAD
jgi:hypothetical protein